MSEYLKAPFPYFGGKGIRLPRPCSPHVFAISLAFPVWVAGRYGCGDVAFLALSLEPVRRSLVAIEVGDRLDAKAPLTPLLCDRPAISIIVPCVFAVRVPAKIFEAVVFLVSVWVVAGFHAFRLWPDECFKNEAVDGSRDGLAVHIQTYKAIAFSVLTDSQRARLPSFA